MKDLNEKLESIIDKSIALAEKTGEFVIDQAPDLLKEFYTWHTYSHIFWIILLSIFVVASVVIVEKITKYEDDGFIRIFHGIGGLISIPLLVNVYNLVFILVAPKLYIIEYFLHK